MVEETFFCGLTAWAVSKTTQRLEQSPFMRYSCEISSIDITISLSAITVSPRFQVIEKSEIPSPMLLQPPPLLLNIFTPKTWNPKSRRRVGPLGHCPGCLWVATQPASEPAHSRQRQNRLLKIGTMLWLGL